MLDRTFCLTPCSVTSLATTPSHLKNDILSREAAYLIKGESLYEYAVLWGH